MKIYFIFIFFLNLGALLTILGFIGKFFFAPPVQSCLYHEKESHAQESDMVIKTSWCWFVDFLLVLFDFYAKKTRNAVIVSVHFFIPDMLGQSHNPDNGSIFFLSCINTY